MTVHKTLLEAANYDLDSTLGSGQSFRWRKRGEVWEGVVGVRAVRLSQARNGVLAETRQDPGDWEWLRFLLQTGVAIDAIEESFPRDPWIAKSVVACRGLRLLRQDPWECLAGFILSANKQIRQIEQIVEALCLHHGGEALEAPWGGAERPRVFPTARAISQCSELELRACKMGFRAPNLRKTAEMVASGRLDLEAVGRAPLDRARELLQTAPGIGPKIADCVLLYGYGAPMAFPLDVWMRRVLRVCYFRGKDVPDAELSAFISSYFGPHPGYAQQYLFHFARTSGREELRALEATQVTTRKAPRAERKRR